MRGDSSAPLRVLVVDDNVDTTSSLAFLLETWGHEVRVAHDGPSAVVGAGEFQPDAILLDIGLPKMDGFEVAGQIRSDPGAGRPFIVGLSGYNRESDRRRAEEVGIDLYLVKPFNPWRLAEILAAELTTPAAVPA